MIDEKKLIESFRASLNTGRETFPIDLIVECIEAQPKVGEWIPCSERLPERYCHCLVTRINEYEDGFDTDVREDTYVEIEGVLDWQSKHEGLIDKVIAWQPMPEAYKQNGETYE